MNLEEMLNKLTEIGTCEDDAQRRTSITEISDEIKTIFGNNEKLTSDNAELDKQIKKVQEHNMQLYLKVQGQNAKANDVGVGEEHGAELRYENLFDDKGELK